MTVPFFLGFLLPLLAGGGAAAGAGGLLGTISAIAGIGSTVATVAGGRRARKDAQNAEATKRKEIADSKAAAAEQYRKTLRSGASGQGTGDFRSGETSTLNTALSQVTGK